MQKKKQQQTQNSAVTGSTASVYEKALGRKKR
jgi:hypothetical protein